MTSCHYRSEQSAPSCGGVSLVLPRRCACPLPCRTPRSAAGGRPVVATVPGTEQRPTGRGGNPSRLPDRVVRGGAVTALTDLGRRVRLAHPPDPSRTPTCPGRGRPHPDARTEPEGHRPHRPRPFAHTAHGLGLHRAAVHRVAGEGVDVILADNGYARTAAPAPGDLAVYRGVEGVVVHTGIVYSAADCTLVESKWGPLVTTPTPPRTSRSAARCASYPDTARPGHLLRGLSPGDDRADRYKAAR